MWFGFRSFWGHLRHFVASAIATEDVDSRDWMTPDEPSELVARIARTLGGDARKPTLVEALGRDVFVDYVSDTGDDVAVSRAVARLVFAPYELPDPDRPGEVLRAPRGDVLVFGGDTAYPVATAQEIRARVVAPWNEVLAALPKGAPRVLLGIPGNHDWYDGLDGFGRMFRRPIGARPAPPTGGAENEPALPHVAVWAREFVLGGQIEKPKMLVLDGYEPVQSASHFALPLAPRLLAVAVDRQLRQIDTRQREFFRRVLAGRRDERPLVLLPDPAYAFGEPRPNGVGMLEALGLDPAREPCFVLSGDVHHYERHTVGASLHVTAGGGGAFLHPAPIAREGRLAPEVEFPDAAQSRTLLRGVGWKVALGRSGLIPHAALVALFLPAVGIGLRIYEQRGVFIPAPILASLVATLAYALLGGVRKAGLRVLPLALVAGVLTGAIPLAASLALDRLAALAHLRDAIQWIAPLTLAIAALAGAFVFGTFLSALTWLGLEHTQAFTALDHPGFKHFVRLRIRADGGGIDAWCIGLVDPLAKDAAPVLVDRVSFPTPAARRE